MSEAGQAQRERGPDPRSVIDAPVRAALDVITAQCTAVIAFSVLVAACPTLFQFDEPFCTWIHAGLPVVLGAWVGASWLGHRLAHRPAVSLIDGWALAWRVDATEARLAVGLSLTAALVLALAFVLVVRFYFFEDGMRSTSIAILLPGLGALYAAVVGTAVPGFADRLARASGRSEARFREYWESIARGAADR